MIYYFIRSSVIIVFVVIFEKKNLCLGYAISLYGNGISPRRRSHGAVDEEGHLHGVGDYAIRSGDIDGDIVSSCAGIHTQRP